MDKGTKIIRDSIKEVGKKALAGFYGMPNDAENLKKFRNCVQEYLTKIENISDSRLIKTEVKKVKLPRKLKKRNKKRGIVVANICLTYGIPRLEFDVVINESRE